MSAFTVVILVSSAACLFVLTASTISHDYSWVDRSWSILPAIYVWIFAGFVGLADARLNVMAVLVTLWAARLTFNFARKGGYSGVEDYRWAVLRTRMKPWQFELFNLFFITLYQNLILLLITLPALTASEHPGTPFGPLDGVVAVLFLGFLAGETVADQQQWTFQQQKKAGGGDFRPRFLTTGLWRFSRHPNFFFEQAQWWALFFFGAIAAGSVLQWTVLGALLLTLLFVGSTVFTETITKSKYPEYSEYQARTSPIVPCFARGGRTLSTEEVGTEAVIKGDQ
jgi:steroid 5-alpha reductase family enzyme